VLLKGAVINGDRKLKEKVKVLSILRAVEHIRYYLK